jgi:hypothetical protein
MSEVDRTGLLIRGTKEKSKDDVFHEHHLHQIPIWTGLRVVFLASYRCISGTIRVETFDLSDETPKTPPIIPHPKKRWKTASSGYLVVGASRTTEQFY